MVYWGLYPLLDCNYNLKGFRCCTNLPVRFGPEELFQDQKAFSSSVLAQKKSSRTREVILGPFPCKGWQRLRPFSSLGENRLMNGRIGMRPPNSFVRELAGRQKSREMSQKSEVWKGTNFCIRRESNDFTSKIKTISSPANRLLKREDNTNKKETFQSKSTSITTKNQTMLHVLHKNDILKSALPVSTLTTATKSP
ncbi:hypothetical protein CDAR_289091 [Caerostris darwini]|uniref:Uncharacterized protein n=1 Tax=Caerostris darwini TaxID=1538125 RepID=A0AAV4PHD3_9ARAC|nr:hypothetical protein CDAR_289091 [Caerostris darwini]